MSSDEKIYKCLDCQKHIEIDDGGLKGFYCDNCNQNYCDKCGIKYLKEYGIHCEKCMGVCNSLSQCGFCVRNFMINIQRKDLLFFSIKLHSQ